MVQSKTMTARGIIARLHAWPAARRDQTRPPGRAPSATGCLGGTGDIEKEAGEFSDLVVAGEQPVVRRCAVVAREAHGIGKKPFDRLDGEIDEPDGGEDADDEYYRDQIDLLADRQLNLQDNQPHVHADVNAAGDAGENRAADLDEVAHSGQAALDGRGAERIAVPDLFGNAGHEGVSEKLARFAGDVDVTDALNLDELVDQGLQCRKVAIEDDVDAGAGDGLGDALAVADVFLGSASV